MSAMNLTQIETLALLMNKGYVVWRQSSGPGTSIYHVYLPRSDGDDRLVGRLNHSTISSLWSRGFLVEDDKLRTDRHCVILHYLRLGVPRLPVFLLGEEDADE